MPVRSEHSSCGVGFAADLAGQATHAILESGLHALRAMEHRGAVGPDGMSSDGAGVMTDIPFDFLGCDPGTAAIATLFMTADPERRVRAFAAFVQTFEFFGIAVAGTREVPVDVSVLGAAARSSLPFIVHVTLRRPAQCRTERSFDALLYSAKQLTRTKLKACGGWLDLYFISLSTRTVVYKGLCRGADLDRFYPDLANPRYKTRFCLLHRRFSTNTRSAWDKAQPFRHIAHNGEINTIAGNRSWAYAREAALGLAPDELLTHADISDSGSLNEMIEALRSRSSIPHLDDILAILMPPADGGPFYEFWGRAVEPWDGPALVAYSDGETVGARLDRNGFRPARWCRTEHTFYLASEAGAFPVEEAQIVARGILHAGTCATVRLSTGKVHFRDPSNARENAGASFDARLVALRDVPARMDPETRAELAAATLPSALDRLALFGVTEEELERVLAPMCTTGKEALGSMGNTARPAMFSAEPRSLYDFFFQDFAQVTNPPLDYLRESLVTDLHVVLGPRPNVFAPRELLPPPPAIVHDGPVLRLAELAALRALTARRPSALRNVAAVIDCTFARARGVGDLRAALQRIADEAIAYVQDGCSLLILSQRAASTERPPVPSLLALRAALVELGRAGLRLEASLVLEAGDIRSTHEVACAVGFGATAVCPFVALELARAGLGGEPGGHDADAAESRLVAALHGGLLKVMSKMGISVVRSYQSSELFTALGLGPLLLRTYFPGVPSPIGGIELARIAEQVCDLAERAEALASGAALPSSYQYKEKARGDGGERHSMTAARSRLVHDLVRGRGDADTTWRAYLEHGDAAEPVNLRHLLDLRPAEHPLALAEVEPAAAILARFVAGAMSFGAISAESQRDLFLAMRSIGARCNSGEGGENPYYFIDGTHATTKQIASARFGVTAEYLVAGDECEIKVAQGAKPGEGGQLMGIKVDADIARARHARPGIDLISPPPLHDIYSIEDLKQLIHELGELRPGVPVSVKLVAGTNIGTIAVGVAKAGARVIHIAGGDGGTGAGPLTSMRHAGLPWELGLVEAHRALCEHGLRDRVTVRVDGGLASARDIVLAALLGAEEFGFGKLLLVAQGCIMARVCEKNRCPTGIATHDPKFKAKYKGEPAHVVTLLQRIADDVRALLASLGARSIAELVGQRRHLRAHTRHHALVDHLAIDLRPLLEPVPYTPSPEPRPPAVRAPLNQRIVDDAGPAIAEDTPLVLRYDICTTDRAVPTGLCGALAVRSHRRRLAALAARPGAPDHAPYGPPPGTIRLHFRGSAGQGFGAFMVEGVALELRGEANDSVCKSMAGGHAVIRPGPTARFVAEEQVILGNGALYGATGGTLLVHGRAGDRFAVRNSGAEAVIEGAGLHACEYMTGGVVVVLGPLSHNACAGMTGGVAFLRHDQQAELHPDYVEARALDDEARALLLRLVSEHHDATGSATAAALLADSDRIGEHFVQVLPRVRA